MSSHTSDLCNRRFGRLVAVRFAGYRSGRKTPRTQWQCLCDCGASVTVARDSLVGKKVRSCGCFALDSRKSNALRMTRHGKSRTPEYAIWRAMKCRCLIPNYSSYHRYGGRGIVVCARWLASFASFIADMGVRPSSRHTLERVDNDGPYSPHNCIWATAQAQRANRANSIRLTLHGETLPLVDWSKRLSISYATLLRRFRELGWSAEKTLTTPLKRSAKLAT
jgi:hypothetical protein